MPFILSPCGADEALDTARSIVTSAKENDGPHGKQAPTDHADDPDHSQERVDLRDGKRPMW